MGKPQFQFKLMPTFTFYFTIPLGDEKFIIKCDFQLNFHQNQIKHVTMMINNVRIRNLSNIRYCYNYEYQAQTLASG